MWLLFCFCFSYVLCTSYRELCERTQDTNRSKAKQQYGRNKKKIHQRFESFASIHRYTVRYYLMLSLWHSVVLLRSWKIIRNVAMNVGYIFGRLHPCLCVCVCVANLLINRPANYYYYRIEGNWLYWHYKKHSTGSAQSE